MKRTSIAAELRSTQKANKNVSDNGSGPRSRSAEEHLDGQPSIVELLGSEASSKQLSKSTLLRALLALKKGDFSARLPLGFAGNGREDRRHVQRSRGVESEDGRGA